MGSFIRRIAVAAFAALLGAMIVEARAAVGETESGRISPSAASARTAVGETESAGAAGAAGAPIAASERQRLQSPQVRPVAQAQPAPAQPRQPPKIPVRTEISRFDGWIVTCNEFEGGPKTRVCSALLQILQEKTNQVVFSWTVGLDDKKQIVSIFQTPTGVAVAPGLELRIGKSPPRKIPFASCDTGRCVATATVDANLLREMTTSPTAQAVIQGEQGNTVEFNIEMKGFDKAYAILSRRA